MSDTKVSFWVKVWQVLLFIAHIIGVVCTILVKGVISLGKCVLSFIDTLYKIIVRILQELWSIFSDVEHNADPWKMGGIAVFILSSFGAIWLFGHSYLPSDKLAIYAGIIVSGTTVGTFLFGQSVKSDANLITRGGKYVPSNT
jgi:hypothetical protein